jgi:hypothetical protein
MNKGTIMQSKLNNNIIGIIVGLCEEAAAGTTALYHRVYILNDQSIDEYSPAWLDLYWDIIS